MFVGLTNRIRIYILRIDWPTINVNGRMRIVDDVEGAQGLSSVVTVYLKDIKMQRPP